MSHIMRGPTTRTNGYIFGLHAPARDGVIEYIGASGSKGSFKMYLVVKQRTRLLSRIYRGLNFLKSLFIKRKHTDQEMAGIPGITGGQIVRRLSYC